jgi:hypothetical protein
MRPFGVAKASQGPAGEERPYLITRRSFVGLMAAAALGGSAVVAVADDAMVVVHKDPNCGCCSLWVQHLRYAGFAVRVGEAADYVLEKHVPAEAVRRLLSERPNAKGIAVPDMPIGSPGMEGGQLQPFTDVLFGPDESRPFMRFIGKQAVG